MNGKQLREWAENLPDDAVIETKDRYSSSQWNPLEPGHIKATMILQPTDIANFTPVEK